MHRLRRRSVSPLLAVLTIVSIGAITTPHGTRSASLPGGAPPLPDLAAGAAVDLVTLYSDFDKPDSTAVVERFEAGIDEVRRAFLAANRDGDVLLEAPSEQNAAFLLRLRTLEALAAASGRYLEGVQLAAQAESLETGLRLQVDELRPDGTSMLPVVAGLSPSRAEARRILPALEAVWQTHCASNAAVLDGATAYLLLHALAERHPESLARMWRGTAHDAWDTAIADLGTAISSRKVTIFTADDPRRSLRLALGALATSGAISSALLDRTYEVFVDEDAFEAATETPERFEASHALLDSLNVELQAHARRATPILGSRTNYYRRTGDKAPQLTPAQEDLARTVGRHAIARLRQRLDSAALAHLDVRATSEVEPVEVVPGQQVAATWTLGSAGARSFTADQATIAGRVTTLRDPTAAIPEGGTASVRTGYVGLPTSSPGTVLALDLTLSGTFEGWRHLTLHDRVTVRVVAPVQASVGPVGDPLLDGRNKSIEAIITSRAPHPVQGTLRVLATSDWKVTPARQFRFKLLRPGQSARAQISIELPELASPGPYDFVVRLDVDGQPIGTLGTRLVKPVEWVVAGPFAKPHGTRALPPENGVSLGGRYTGLGGRQIGWQAAPRDAYDADGTLDLEALFPELDEAATACALTVIESPEVTPAVVRLTGVSRALWNGNPLPADGQVRIERGRNTLLVRTSTTDEGWRLQAELRNPNGEPLRVLANDLSRLLDGYADLEKAARPGSDGQPPDRVVVVRFQSGTPPSEVAVLGSFNAWVPQGLARLPDGTWQRELRLPPGRYSYKLLVDGRLRPDPTATASEPDGFGGRNSLLIVR
jgi:Glycogen recognition site of AMP-activated protein kinase